MEQEKEKIIKFIRRTLKAQGFEKAIIAVSGGIDSAVCLTLLSQAISKLKILVLKLPYGRQNMALADLIINKNKIALKNIKTINIKPAVDLNCKLAGIYPTDKIRRANIMARTRMIFIYDLAKKHSALVCGTENKSEHLLGYYTRFGDSASDLEPIRHLYKTQVYQLAEKLKIPEKIIRQAPSAGLWPGQTDEQELGFTYNEADQILELHLEKKLKTEKIRKIGFKNAEKIIKRWNDNLFKQQTPYKK